MATYSDDCYLSPKQFVSTFQSFAIIVPKAFTSGKRGAEGIHRPLTPGFGWVYAQTGRDVSQPERGLRESFHHRIDLPPSDSQ